MVRVLNQTKFAPLYRKYVDQIWRFCYLRTSDPELADDMTSEVFLRAWQSDAFADANHKAYLYQIAKNLLVDHWRRQKGDVSLDAPVRDEEGVTLADTIEDEDTPSPLERAHATEAIRKVAKAITNIPERLRDVVILRFVEQLSAKETAEILDTTESNVRVLQHRALKAVRKEMK